MAAWLPTSSAQAQASGSFAVVAEVDVSNQAGWWTPVTEHGGATYYAYDAPGSRPETHVVYVARRASSGTTRSCLSANGACIQFPDDVGHHQPSIAIDGDGYVHVFTAMHSSTWPGHYFRSTTPNSVSGFVERGGTLPDQSWTFTYPVLATGPDGDLYLAIRGRSSPTAGGVGGRLYHYDPGTGVWSRVATFAYHSGLWTYPDDLVVDSAGRVHILYMWVNKRDNRFTRVGGYLVYEPSSRRLTNAAGTDLGPTPNFFSDASYQPWPASYVRTHPNNGTGVEVAKMTLDRSSGRPQIAYRYRRWDGERMHVRRAVWDGQQWRRSYIYRGRYDTFPAIDITGTGPGQRIYYVKRNTIGGPAAFVAEQTSDGRHVERSLARQWPKIERLSVIARADGTDVIYLSAPRARTTSGELYLGTLPRP